MRGTTKPLAGTAFYVLLALADKDRYGLDIVSEIARRTHDQVHLGPGTLYNAIKKMLGEGLIAEAAPEAGPDADPRRKYYGITPEGRRRLSEEAARLDALVSAAREKGATA